MFVFLFIIYVDTGTSCMPRMAEGRYRKGKKVSIQCVSVDPCAYVAFHVMLHKQIHVRTLAIQCTWR